MFSPKELAREICEIGKEKVAKTFLQIFLSGILAGVFVGFGYYGYCQFMADTETTLSINRFFGSFTFTTGIIMILVAGGELFTGNCLIAFGCYSKCYNIRKSLRNLAITYFGNMVGAFVLAFLIAFSKPSTAVSQLTETIIQVKLSLSFGTAFVRGILCNILVSVAVYMSCAARSIGSKILAVFFPVFLFVVSGYEHSVANMFILPFGMSLSGWDIGGIAMNLLPVTLGNLIGGSVIIPGAYYLIFLRKTEKKEERTEQ